MARLTKEQRIELEAARQTQRAQEQAEWRNAWPQRFMQLAYIATRAYLDHELRTNPFSYFEARSDGSIFISIRSEWGGDREIALNADSALWECAMIEQYLDDAIEQHREEMEQDEKRRTALNKLTPEDRAILGL